MHGSCGAQASPSSPAGTFRSNSPAAEAIRALVHQGIVHGGIRRAARRVAPTIDLLPKAEKWLYDQNEGYGVLTVPALIELLRECPPHVRDEVRAELFPEAPAEVDVETLERKHGALVVAFGAFEVCLGRAMSDGKLNAGERSSLRRCLESLIGKAQTALAFLGGRS